MKSHLTSFQSSMPLLKTKEMQNRRNKSNPQFWHSQRLPNPITSMSDWLSILPVQFQQRKRRLLNENLFTSKQLFEWFLESEFYYIIAHEVCNTPLQLIWLIWFPTLQKLNIKCLWIYHWGYLIGICCVVEVDLVKSESRIHGEITQPHSNQTVLGEIIFWTQRNEIVQSV